MSERYFYSRVSARDQNLARQLAVARQYKDIPPNNVFCDKQSGKNFCRDEYMALKSRLCAGDEVIVKELDRLGRNKEEIKSEIAWFKENGIDLRILDVPTTLIDFQGQEWIRDMVNNILIEVLGAMAEQEREKTLRRQKEGIEAMPVDAEGYKYSTKTGRRFGRSAKCPENFATVYARQQRGEISVSEAMSLVGVGRTRWYELARQNSCRA
jgi:DNA invertase Pin-like site-specific DNA recombinase